MSSQYLKYLNGELHFGTGAKSLKLRDFAKDQQGPVYLYNADLIRSRVRQMQKALPNVKMYYAMKANSFPGIMQLLKAEGVGADVVSGGEIHRALESGYQGRDIIYSGVGKTKREIQLAIGKNIAQINVESMPELLRIAEIAKAQKARVPISLRLNPDIEIKTHKYIATGLKDNKFGMELSLLPQLIETLKAHQDHLTLEGISLHLGSQMLEFEPFREALQKLVPVYQKLQSEFSSVQKFDFGGGLGIFYEEQNLDKESELLQQYADVALSELKNLKAELQCEPGRWLVAHAGVLLSQVQYIKKTSHKNFIILDTGMHHLLRPALYGSFHQIHPLKESDQFFDADVVGPICESADFLAQNRKMMQVSADDFVAIADAGAYGYSMQSQYNLQEGAREVLI